MRMNSTQESFVNWTNPCLVFINATHYYDICEYVCEVAPNNRTKYVSPDHDKIIVIRTLIAVVLAAAIIGIILTIIVLSRKHMCTSTNCYLISLAVADLGFLIILSTKWLETEIEDYFTFDIYNRYAQIFLDTFLMASVWVTVMLSIERYIAICHSLKANSICTVKRARIINTSVFLLAFLCRIPNFFEYSIKTGYMYHDCVEIKKSYIHITKLGANINYKIAYAWVFDCVLCAIVPFLALLFLNVRLVVEIRKSTHYLMDTLGNDLSNLHNVLGREQRRVTLMLISIVIVFFICQAPHVIVAAYRSVHRYSMKGFHHAFNIVTEVTVLLLALKSALNFILYCWFSEKFWDTFKKELCRKICMFFKRNREFFGSRSNSDTHHNSLANKSFRKSSAPIKETSVKINDVQC